MKQGKLFFLALLTGAGALLAAQGLEFSGVADSKVAGTLGAADAPDFSFGAEAYANLRAQAKIRDRAVFYGALNAVASAGASALPGAAEENYTGAIELERLYFRLNSEYADVDAGLMRLAFGYGQVFAPPDFLNPRNPLFPDARKRGVLAAAVSAYPVDMVKLLAFAASPRDPLNSAGGGALFGLSADKHWQRASVQTLYAFETPRENSPLGIHRFGLSFKADLGPGFVGDALYVYNYDAFSGMDALSAAAGADYSFFDGRVYVLAEYLYNGPDSATAASAENPAGFSHAHYLYGMLLFRFSDYAGASLSCMAGLEDGSLLPALGFEHEIVQGLSLELSARLPLDKAVFDSGGAGEFGPERLRERFDMAAKARLRF
jgi:hypothetical protein